MSQSTSTPSHVGGATRRVYIVPHFHYDVAYVQSTEKHLVTAMDVLCQALDLLEAEPEYRYLVEQTYLLEAVWERMPEQRARLVALAQAGRLAVSPGLYVMPDMNHPSGESLFQQARLGRQWLHTHLGIEPTVCWIPDCWGHPAQLPQILRQSGYDYYAFWRAMNRQLQRRDFRWRGLDGSILSTHWLSLGYGGGMFADELPRRNEPPAMLPLLDEEQLELLCERMDHFAGDASFLIPNGADFLPPQPSAVARVTQAQASGRFESVCLSGPVDYLCQVDWEAQPIVDGEFNSMFQGSFASNIHIKQLNRRCTQQLIAIEAFGVLMRCCEEYDSLWRLLLKQQFHDIICGTICDEALADCMAEFGQLTALFDCVIDRLSQAPESEPGYFNALPFERCELIEGDDGPALISLSSMGFTPSSQARVIALGSSRPDLPTHFENEFFHAKIGREGYLESLGLRGDHQELVTDLPAPFGALAIQWDCGDLWLNFQSPLAGGAEASAWANDTPDPFDPTSKDDLVMRQPFVLSVQTARVIEISDVHLKIEQESAMQLSETVQVRCSTRMTLAQGCPWIRYRTVLHPVGRHYRLRAVFPVTLKEGVVTHEIPFGVQVRGSGEHVTQNWFSYADSARGVAILNRGTPSANVHDDCMMVTLFRSAAMEHAAPSAASFHDRDPHTFEYAVMPFWSSEAASVVRAGAAFNMPPLACRAPGGVSGLFRFEAEHVLLSACRWVGSRVFVRLYETLGKEVDIALQVAPWLKAVAACDAFGHPSESFGVIRQQCVVIPFRAFEIKSFLFELAENGGAG